MKKPSSTDKLLLANISQAAESLQHATRGLSMGELIKRIRNQLKMSQIALAKRAGLQQSTLSRIEYNRQDASLSTLSKILKALSCDLVVAPVLKQPLDEILRQQAKNIAQKHVLYLRGTMSLEKQEPDKRLLEELIKKEIEYLLQGSGKQLWKE